MNAVDERIEALIVERASQWYARHRDGGLTPEESGEFMAWLQASPLHVREYLVAASLADKLSTAVASLNVDRLALEEQARRWLNTGGNVVGMHRRAVKARRTTPVPRRFAVSRKTVAVAAALVCLVGAGLYWSLGQYGLSGWSRVLEAKDGGQRTVRLRDGSVLHLNADTEVRVRYSGAQRLVELNRGRAMFDVARDTSRAFVVRAGSTDIVAIGTRFDVHRQNARQAVIVTVVEGRVDVIDRDAPAVASPAAAAHPMRLGAGQQIRLAPDIASPHAESVNARAETAWLRRELIFTEQRLGEVAEQFSQYGEPIEIDDPALRDYRVSGVFDAYDTESFVEFLKRFGDVERAERGIRVHAADRKH